MITADEAVLLAEKAIDDVSVEEFDAVIRQAATEGRSSVIVRPGSKRIKHKLEKLGFWVAVDADKALTVSW